MTSKELSYLSDALNSEQVAIKKYQDYSNSITDAQLKSACNDIIRKHQNHYTQLIQQFNA
jgi:rubrerythrin